MRVKQFTMIEVIMALIIIVIAIVAITGLFPLGMRVHNNAIRQSQATDIAEEILELAALKTKGNIQFPLKQDVITTLSNAPLDINTTWNEQTTVVNGLTDSKYYYYTGGLEKGLVRVLRSHKAHRDGKEYNVDELDVVLAIWRSPDVSADFINSSTGVLDQGVLKNTNVVRLTIEASWPGSAEYEIRKKFTLVTEVRK